MLARCSLLASVFAHWLSAHFSSSLASVHALRTTRVGAVKGNFRRNLVRCSWLSRSCWRAMPLPGPSTRARVWSMTSTTLTSLPLSAPSATSATRPGSTYRVKGIASDYESPIADVCWSPKHNKLAVATCERAVLLFDREGVRRDKFSTKPADPAAGKKSYHITGVAWSENGELLAVAQSDGMVFVYRLGADWGGKKVICNKFPLSSAPTALLAATVGPANAFVVGTVEGKIRSLDCRSNKSSSLWSGGGSACVALSAAPRHVESEARLCSAHVDGNIFINGRMLLRYPLPATALSLSPPYLVVGSCDGRISVYDAERGALVRTVEPPQLMPDKKELIKAVASPSGQIAFGILDGCLVAELKESGALDVSMLSIPKLYAARALAWSADGTSLALGSHTGAVLLYQAVLRRWVWRDTVEVRHVSPRRLLVSRLAADAPPLAVDTTLGAHIHSVRFMANDWYAVCRTNSSLILCDIARGLTSEIPWTTSAGGGERFYMSVGGACLVHRAGELSVIEYGLDRVLHTVRTERVNPHVLSVRINEARATSASSALSENYPDNKKLAYMLDRQTVAVVDLVTGVQIGQWWHESRVDWLEMSEAAEMLLYRDTRRRLTLLNLVTGAKEIIASGIGFVQWIENSDAVVAQTPTHLLVWYSAWEPHSVELLDAGGGVAVQAVDGRILLNEGTMPHIHLDSHRLTFNSALRANDFAGCAEYLSNVSDSGDIAPLWRQLAEKAMSCEDLQLAAKCYSAIGDNARAFFLNETIQLAITEGDGGFAAGLNSPLVRAQLAIFSGSLKDAEEQYVRRLGRSELAIDMYKNFHRWQDAISMCERVDRPAVAALRQQHMDYLTATGRLGALGGALAAAGDARGAVAAWLRGGRARRAAQLLLQNPPLLHDAQLADTVHTQLLQEEWWEVAGELSERRGDAHAAVGYFAKGHNYARAVQLAREACPGEVTRLEGEWGAWLVAARQAGAAVPHLIEAGDTRAALAAALKAHHYRKALQIIQVIDDKESIREQCLQLGEQLMSSGDWESAESVLVGAGLAERAVQAHNAAGRHADGLRLASKHLSEQRASEIYVGIAEDLKKEGQLRKAEAIYIGLGEYDEAISMYKEAAQYEHMLRLVGAHRGELLEATRQHVAQALQASGDMRAAEKYYLQAGDWKSAIQMYRTAGSWENAERVARAHAPPAVQQQVALVWAGSLGGAAGARLLAARGLAAAGARWALAAQRWDLAEQLSALGAPISRQDVLRHEAAALAEEQPEEAEAAYLRADAAEHAVDMWLQRGEHQRALRLAETHAPNKTEEVLVSYARSAAERGDLAQYEALMIRANRPLDVVQMYKEHELWEEATRVSREYLPDGAEPVPPSVPPLLQRAADHANNGEWWEAVQCLCAASAAGATDGAAKLAERAALRAARLARDHLLPQQRARAARMLHERFIAIGQETVGEQLKIALTSGYSGEDDDGEMSEEEDAETVEPNGGRVEAGGAYGTTASEEDAALERLARAGQWERCLAQAAAGPLALHYTLRYAQHLFHTHPRQEKVEGENEDAPEALSQALSALKRIPSGSSPSDDPLVQSVCSELLLRSSSLLHPSYETLRDARDALHAVGASARMIQSASLQAVLAAGAPAQAALRAARAMLRYTDILVADAAFYKTGVALREAGSEYRCEAFVLLNRCLDLAEAADDNSANLLDHTDFECTDFPRSPLLLESACVRGARLHDVREWVLAVSMDQDVQQSLPLDSRGLYEASLPGVDDACCVLTGYPLHYRLVTFTDGRCADREQWSRLVAVARGGGASADVLAFITLWCGPGDYHAA